jgi:hypothetical protein
MNTPSAAAVIYDKQIRLIFAPPWHEQFFPR